MHKPSSDTKSRSTQSSNRISLYYQAGMKRELIWLATATLRLSEHVVFDRTIDKENSIFEFFVSPDLEDVFLDIMHKLEKRGMVFDLQKLPNRLL